MKSTVKKILCIALCLSLLVSLLSISTYADTDDAIQRVTCCVNGDTKTQRGFCWYTPEESESHVRIYLNGIDVTDTTVVTAQREQEWEGMYMHQVTVSGLEAGKAYTYKVGDGENWSKTGKFTTDNGDDKVNFISIADVQASSEENFERASWVMDAALETMPDAEFVSNLGDFTNDSTNEEWDGYFKYFERHNLATSLVPIAGNHDGLGVWHWFDNMFDLDTSESVQNLNGVNYSFDYGNAHFAVLNTNDMLSISDAQLTWLKNDMNSSSADWKIAFMHKSPYSLGKDGKWPDALYLTEALTKVVDECGIDVVMSGHDHSYVRTKSLKDNKVVEDGEGTVYVLDGTAGTKRYEIREFSADTYLNTDFIAALTIQRDGYGNYWDGDDYESTDPANIGGSFTTVSIDGGELKLTAYVLTEETKETKVIDTFTLTKETGNGEATFEGDNTTSVIDFALTVIPSFIHLAEYALLKWLPKTIFNLPKIIYYVIKTDTF